MKATLFLAIFLVSFVTLVIGQCPNSSWTRRGNKCFFVKLEDAGLYENIALCNQLNASMVSITNDEENFQLTRLLPFDYHYWLGLGHRSKEFYWFDGSPFVYNSWMEEPSVAYKYFGAYFREGDWFTDTALSLKNQVCSLDLTLNAAPKKTPIPAEFRERPGQCPNTTWRRGVNKCIYFDRTKKMTFRENQALCKGLNATMVSIHSEEEHNHLLMLLGYRQFWIGLKRISRTDWLYEWEDGSPKTYENWMQGYPRYLGKKYWAAYACSEFWCDAYMSDQYYPCCQSTVLTQAEQVSTETTSYITQLTSTVRTMDKVSKNTESPSDVVTTATTELPWTASTYDETITASEAGMTTTITGNGQQTEMTKVTKNVIQLLKDVIGKLTDIVTKIQKSET